MSEKPEKPSMKQVIGSVLAGFFGVQSDKNRQRDFSSGSPRRFVLVGIISTIILVFALLIIVGFVMIIVQ